MWYIIYINTFRVGSSEIEWAENILQIFKKIIIMYIYLWKGILEILVVMGV